MSKRSLSAGAAELAADAVNPDPGYVARKLAELIEPAAVAPPPVNAAQLHNLRAEFAKLRRASRRLEGEIQAREKSLWEVKRLMGVTYQAIVSLATDVPGDD